MWRFACNLNSYVVNLLIVHGTLYVVFSVIWYNYVIGVTFKWPFFHITSAWMVGIPTRFMLVIETKCGVLYIQTILLWALSSMIEI